MREYEFTLIAKGDLPEAERTKALQGYEEILKRNGGAIIKRDDWGVKRLAYPIKKQFRGQYVFYHMASTPENVAEAERLLRIDENILRHIVIKTLDDVDVEARKAELAKASAQQQKERERERD